ncbi:MAG: 3-oxoacyl-ACP synthase III [Thermodesulfobacteriota bacterium]|nr:3-oxoacyl-ACP synthase III [Thermodesulfobacteriota bacterium]
MKYSKVFINSICYELAPNVVTTDEIEAELKPFYNATGFKSGQLETITGIRERRFWDIDHTLAEGSAKAGQKAIEASGISPDEIGALVFCGVGRDGFEPATACAVADKLKISSNAHVYDVSNACLGVITGMVQVANEIELGNIKAGLVVSSETARQIVESTINEINERKSVEFYKRTIATMTGGSGAVAVLLTDGSVGQNSELHKIQGGVVQHSNEHHDLCRWTFKEKGMPTDSKIQMRTNAQAVLEHGLLLAQKTFKLFKKELNLSDEKFDKFICHQVGSTHQMMFHQAINIDPAKDFATYAYLGNIGTVSLPITAALADERGFLKKGDYVGFLGIGSGLNCLMMGIDW